MRAPFSWTSNQKQSARRTDYPVQKPRKRLRFAAVYAASLCLFSGLAMPAADLAKYRDFVLGADLASIAKQAHLDVAKARVIHERPALIQELQWEPRAASPSIPDPVRDITFRFYNGKLYRIAINYDRYTTAGLRADDFIEALSFTYGSATKPATTVNMESLIYAESEPVIARWEDSEYSYNLLRSTYQPTFGVLAFSKRLETLAKKAIFEAIWLDKQEAPQKEAASLREQAAQEQIEQEKARVANKPNFRP